MGYDTLTRVLEFTESDLDINVRLKKVAGLLVKDFPFDSCAFYIWDEMEKLFTLSVSAGSRKGRVGSYGEDEGLPGLARKKMRPLEAYTPRVEATQWKRTEDRGLAGFKSASVYPLKNKHRCFGVLYLKSGRKLDLPLRKKKTLDAISLLLSTNLKCSHHAQSLKKAGTRIKDIHTKLSQAEKLLVLGELSATLIHEIKSPLMSLGGFASRLRKKLEPGSPLLVYSDYIVKEVRRLEGIINDILSYTEEKEAIFEGEDVNSIISEVLTFFSDAFKRNNIEVVTVFTSKPLPVMADRQHLKIAFDNLVANAVQSMESGGKLAVSTSGTKNWVVVNVTDSGGGIKPELVETIFDPFFTTKKLGTGLGLDITRRIITKHEGCIELKNTPGRGVTFSVKLPHAIKVRGAGGDAKARGAG